MDPLLLQNSGALENKLKPFETELVKPTRFEVTNALKKRKVELKKRRERESDIKKNHLFVYESEIKKSLYYFSGDREGFLTIPFRIVFRKTSTGIEKLIAQKYPEFFTWQFYTIDPSNAKRYFEMKKEIMSGLDRSDINSLTQFFFEDRNFFPLKKRTRWTWVTLKNALVKPYGEEEIPYIVLEGNLNIWGRLWFNDQMKISRVTLKKFFGGRTFSFNWKFPFPYILQMTNYNLIRDWFSTELEKRIRDPEEVEGRLFQKILETKERDLKKTKMIFSWPSRTTLNLEIHGIYTTLWEKLWKNKWTLLFGVLLYRTFKKNKETNKAQ